jgi:phage baseplate assembly protein W
MTSFKNTGVLSESNIFNKKIIKKPAGIATPVSYSDLDSGVFKTNTSAVDQIKDNFRNLVLTNKGERLGKYDYGSDLRKFVSEISNIPDFENAVMESILQATQKYMPMIDLESFNAEYNDDTNQELKNITITVRYNIPLMSVVDQKLDVTLYIV